jgi:uncharacterized protein (DUF433 family)
MGDLQYLDTGIYTISRASELTGVSPLKIRDWLYGNARGQHVGRWQPILPREKGRPLMLAFVDLVEVVLVDAFRKGGVSWPRIGKAIGAAHTQYGGTHPFVTKKFFTEIQNIYLEMPNSYSGMTSMETWSGQMVWTDMVDPLRRHREAMQRALEIYAVLDYAEDGLPFRWHPIGRDRAVVLDKRVAMGEPITAEAGIPTRVVVDALKIANFDRSAVREGYGVSEKEIESAIEYEATRERAA